MFNIGDAVIYPNAGLCIIEDIRNENFLGKEEPFYVITPVYSKGSTLFSAVSNDKISIRNVVSGEVLSEILSVKEDLLSGWIDNNHDRQSFYSEILKSCDLAKTLSAVKSLNYRKVQKEKLGKRLHMADEKALVDLEKMLYGEVAYVLGISYDDAVEMFKVNM